MAKYKEVVLVVTEEELKVVAHAVAQAVENKDGFLDDGNEQPGLPKPKERRPIAESVQSKIQEALMHG